MELNSYITALETGEEFLLERLYQYASEAEYTRYTNTKEKEWRMSLQEPTRLLIEFLQEHQETDPIHVEEKFSENPTTAFGVHEAKSHRERGVRFDMFMGLTKLVRLAFIDLIYETNLTAAENKQAMSITHQFFDKLELGFSSEWISFQESDLTSELQIANRRITNEKNCYLTIFQSIAEPVFVVDKKMRIIEVNKAFERLFGVTNKTITGKQCNELFKHDSCENCPFKKAIRENSSFSNIEIVIPTAEGARIVLMGGSFLTDISGKYVGGVAILQDITERKFAEEAKNQAHLELEQIFNAAVPLCVVDKNFQTIKANDTFCAFFNVKEEELLWKKCHDIWNGPACDSPKCTLKQILTKQDKIEYETSKTLHDGRDITCMITSTPYKDSKDNTIGMIQSFVDITERKQAEEELQKRTHDLGELLKELKCLYNITSLFASVGVTIDLIMQKAVNLIPPSWQYPKITCARIILNEKTFTSVNFKETEWKQSSNIYLHGKEIGSVDVFYLEERPESDEGPFTLEERNLLNAIAVQLGRIIKRHQTEESLRGSEAKLKEQKRILEQKNIALKEVLEYIGKEKKEIHENVMSNVDTILLPTLKRLKMQHQPINKLYLDVLQSDIEELTSSFSSKITKKDINLAPREVEVCNLVKSGLANKEIAELLNISDRKSTRLNSSHIPLSRMPSSA